MDYQLVVFDMDGTLTESRVEIDKEMADLFCRLISQKTIVVISGGNLKQIQNQFLNFLSCNQYFSNLHIAPLSGGSLYSFQNGGLVEIYETPLRPSEKEKIMLVFNKALEETGFQKPEKVYGILIEDRGGQITFSALGNEAPAELKKQWDPDHQKRAKIKASLEKYLPEWTIEIGGLTSIDVRPRDIDKAYGIKKISEYLSIPLDKILFVGDAIFAEGNDYSVTKLGSTTIKNVSGPAETKEIIKEIIKI